MTEKLDEHIRGVYIIAATPFEDDGKLDLASTDQMVDFCLESGVNGMTILGIMGEAPKLTPDEQQSFMKRVFTRIGGKIPVVVGVSNPGTNNLAAFAHSAMEAGAAGVMIAATRRPEDRGAGDQLLRRNAPHPRPRCAGGFPGLSPGDGRPRIGSDAAPDIRRSSADRDAEARGSAWTAETRPDPRIARSGWAAHRASSSKRRSAPCRRNYGAAPMAP